MTWTELTAYVEHFRHRVLQDALAEATASYWHRRADAFEWAKPRLGEHHGHRDQDHLGEKWRELDEIATACRNRAAVSLIQDEIEPDVIAALREAS